jgi:tetratricopeptide (TPR) repeat protein
MCWIHGDSGKQVKRVGYLVFSLTVALVVLVVAILRGWVSWPFGASKEVGGLEGAIAEFQTAIRLEPDNSEAYDYLSLAYRLDGRLEEAIEVYQEAAEINPGQAWPYLGLGDLYMDQGDVEEAAAEYQQAVALEPYVVYGYERLAQAYEAQGDLEAALAQHLRAADMALEPETGIKPYLEKAEGHISEGDLKAAASAIETARGVMPYDPHLLSLAIGLDLALMERYRAQGQVSAARSKAWEVLAMDPKQKLALEMLIRYDFIDQLDGAQIDAPREPFEHLKVASFTMPATGDKRQVLFMHPEARASYQLEVPSEPSVLRFSLAMSPETWDWGGDGATFEVYLDEGSGEELLFSRHIGNDAEDRGWHDEEIDLSPYAGQEVVLTFATGPGPGADFTGDAAGWAAPRIMLK